MAQKRTPAARAERTLLARSIDDYLADVKARKRRAKTLHYYEAVLTKQFLPFCMKAGVSDLAHVDQKLVDKWTTNLGERLAEHPDGKRDHLSIHTVHSYERTVNQFLRWARREGEITRDVKAQQPRLPRLERNVLQQADYEALLAEARPDRDKLILEVLWNTGIRASELTGLRVDDLIEGGDRTYWLRVRGKGGDERQIQILPRLNRSLRKYATSRGHRESARQELWLGLRRDANGDTLPLSPSGLGQLLGSLADAADLRKKVNPHIWRHSFATRMILKGMDLMSIQKILGHKSLAMLQQHYSHVTTSEAGKKLMAVLMAEERGE
jgi:integrase/recombinase XerD